VKYYSATEARANWFRILDEVAEGESVVVERKGKRILLCCEGESTQRVPDYQGILVVEDEEQADQWGWDWTPEEGLQGKTT